MRSLLVKINSKAVKAGTHKPNNIKVIASSSLNAAQIQKNQVKKVEEAFRQLFG